jgi:hypothetical protein
MRCKKCESWAQRGSLVDHEEPPQSIQQRGSRDLVSRGRLDSVQGWRFFAFVSATEILFSIRLSKLGLTKSSKGDTLALLVLLLRPASYSSDIGISSQEADHHAACPGEIPKYMHLSSLRFEALEPPYNSRRLCLSLKPSGCFRSFGSTCSRVPSKEAHVS